MDPSLALAKRGMLCYFRDRQNVFFSLMGVLIVVMLYLLFLKNTLVSSWPDYPGMSSLVDAWVLSGILAIVPVTTCAGALQIMVEDRSNGRDKDICVTPMPAYKVAFGYVLSTFAVGTLMSYITLVICVVYLLVTGCAISFTGILISALLVIPSSLSASIIMYAITSFIKSTGAFSGLYTVVSVLIGFLAGIYMPMGVMPDAMKVVGSLVPASQMAVLFRDTLAADALNEVFIGAPADVISSFRAEMGFDLSLGDFMFSDIAMIGYVFVATVIFFAIAVMRIRR